MGIVQDTLCGVSELTGRDTFLEEGQAMQLVMQLYGIIPSALPPPAIHKPSRRWTGKQLFSLLLPPVDLSSPPAGTALDDTVLIVGGELVRGVICKKTVGTSGGGLVHIICRDFGRDAMTRFFNGCQLLVNYYLSNVGFSVGVGDCRVTADTAGEIERTLSGCEESVRRLSQRYTVDSEPKIADLLTAARDAAGRASQSRLKARNNFKRMVAAGSKGNPINISQITACVGQQHVEGKRIPYGFHDRTLPHFQPRDQTAAARGFVKSSYRGGLGPTEFFFHAMGGREGLIDTAVKTAETGYIQRRLIKALEDVSVAYDGTVRNSRGEINQFSYGEDGLDGACLEKVSTRLPMMDDRAILTRCEGRNDARQLIEVRDALRRIRDNADEAAFCPVPFRRILLRASRSFPGPQIEPEAVTEGLEALVRRLPAGASLFVLLARSFLAPCDVLKHRLSREGFAYAVEQCVSLYQHAHVHPGEMVGVLAAQSIGEPATQMTLNTFHVSLPAPF